MNKSSLKELEIDSNENIENELLCSTIFDQIKECGDIISSILLIHKFIKESDVSTDFNPDQLRLIALKSCDDKTSTCLWHINALIAVSSDFKSLLIGIEMMFDRFLGSKKLFIKEKTKNNQTVYKSTSKSSTQNHDKNNKFIGNEIISVVNSYYNDDEPSISSDDNNNDNDTKQEHDSIMETPHRNDIIHDENNENDANNMNKYRGKISSPISFRLRQQKRRKQSERKVTSRNASVDINYSQCSKLGLSNLIYDDGDDDDQYQQSQLFEPEILSPFNVNKFAKVVDLANDDTFRHQHHIKTI